jgi:2-amino-4-hydroxy-6-hydroxymethyldihydropteridine diphosphokinase
MPFTETKMNEAYLLIGGNVGDRMKWLEKACKSIETRCGEVTKVSSIYETEAWGNQQQESFLNQAIQLETLLSAQQLLETILDIEARLGRKREARYGPRTIDIDILFYNDLVLDSDHLVIPHPEIENRRFALECLNEIAPGKIHPKLHKTISQLLDETNDPLKVNKIY